MYQLFYRRTTALLHCCIVARQVFTRLLHTNCINLIIASLLHCCIVDRCMSSIYALIPSVLITSILSLLHHWIANRCTSGIYALTPCQLLQFYYRCTSSIYVLIPSVSIASILSPLHYCIINRCILSIHVLTPSQLHQSYYCHTAALLHYCTSGIYVLTQYKLHQSCHRYISSIHALTLSVPIASILSPAHYCIAEGCTSGIYIYLLWFNCINYITIALLYCYITVRQVFMPSLYANYINLITVE